MQHEREEPRGPEPQRVLVFLSALLAVIAAYMALNKGPEERKK